MTHSSGLAAGASAATARIVRHTLSDRVFHWVTAASVLTLLGTAFLPILGLKFSWLAAHWIAGLVLMAAVAFHTVRALFWQRLGSIWIGRADFGDALGIVRTTLRLGAPMSSKPGKYSFAQKLIHHAFAAVLLTALVSGALMLKKIDTPWWEANPYWLSDDTWGVVYVFHGLAALTLITMVMMHVYFALRPEKWLFTRAMVRGWITREEYAQHHDPKRWQVDP